MPKSFPALHATQFLVLYILTLNQSVKFQLTFWQPFRSSFCALLVLLEIYWRLFSNEIKFAWFELLCRWLSEVDTFPIPVLLKLGVYGNLAMSIFLTLSIFFLLASYLASYKHMEVVDTLNHFQEKIPLSTSLWIQAYIVKFHNRPLKSKLVQYSSQHLLICPNPRTFDPNLTMVILRSNLSNTSLKWWSIS